MVTATRSPIWPETVSCVNVSEPEAVISAPVHGYDARLGRRPRSWTGPGLGRTVEVTDLCWPQ